MDLASADDTGRAQPMAARNFLGVNVEAVRRLCDFQWLALGLDPLYLWFRRGHFLAADKVKISAHHEGIDQHRDDIPDNHRP